jgi:hypothetical protein
MIETNQTMIQTYTFESWANYEYLMNLQL